MLPTVFIVAVTQIAQLDPLTPVGSLTVDLRSPARIAIATDGTVLVSDPFNNHVARFDAAGAPLGTWSIPEGPLGVAAHPTNGNYYVSLRDESEVAIYDSGFAFVGYLGEGIPVVDFIAPTDLDIDTDTGIIYVVDTQGHKFYGFNPDGSLALMAGGQGSLAGQFNSPTAIAVDEPRNRILVSDLDNFRIQVFTTGGVFLQHFGARLKYEGVQEGLMPRTAGVAVDADGNIYVTDMLMGTVRIFDQEGTELGKVVEYGYGVGNVRIPCDLDLSDDGSLLYVVSTNTSSVEMYDAPAIRRSLSTSPGNPGFRGLPLASTPERVAAKGVEPPALDLAHSGFEPEVRSTWDGPHLVDAADFCGRCHGVTGQPGTHAGTVEGQAVLCMSCHSAGGLAAQMPIHEGDIADPYGTNPDAADGQGRSHAWGVSAVNPAADSVGPAAGGMMGWYLYAGTEIKCSTCHNQHNSDSDFPYLRVSNEGDAMCKECHAPRDEGLGERGTHPVGFDYPGDTGEFPADGDVSPLFIKDSNIECMTCHALHNADSGGANDGEGDGLLLRKANSETLCLTCHAEHVGHTTGGGWEPTCHDCHDVHDPANENLALVAAEVNGTAMTFEDNEVDGDGLTDFIHSNHPTPSYDGMCEGCHTSTAYHRGSADGDHDHFADRACTDCHLHMTGFKGVPEGPSHATHLTSPRGPGISDCADCHITYSSPVELADGNPLSTTTVCDDCHSPDGAFDGVDDSTIGARVNWDEGVYEATDPFDLKPGKEQWCVGCHDLGSSTIQTVSAPPVAGDNATWGYFNSGHGRNRAVGCTYCHDTTAAHIDGLARTYSFDSADYAPAQSGVAYAEAYRLKDVGGEVPLMIPANYSITFGYDAGLMRDTAFRLCLDCHDSSKLFDDTPGDGIDSNFKASQPNPPRDYSYAWGSGADVNEHVAHIMNYIGPFADSDWDAATNGPGGSDGRDTMTACSSCHNVHGAAGNCGSTNSAMIRDGTLVGRTGYGFSYVMEDSGGFPNVTSDGATQVTSVGSIFRTNTSDMCGGSMCHGDPTPPGDCGYDATGSGWGTYLEYYRPWVSTVGCTACHAQPLDDGDGVPPGGRRAATGDFWRPSHHVHIQGEARGDDCAVCHDMTQHTHGHVRLKDPDDFGVVYDHDTATATEMEAFCLNCHDADGAADGAGTVPFSDGVTVPDIDRAGLWAASAHSTGGTTGSANTCVSCHGNGHGSGLQHLLLPWDGVPGTDNVNEEEGFCYTCHGVGGVINETVSNGWFSGVYENFGDSVEAAFGMASFHPVNDSAAGHVFDLGSGPQELECTSCHNVHEATGKHWEAVSNKVPAALFGTGELWGDTVDEKIDAYGSGPTDLYQAPRLGEPGDDLSGNPLPIDDVTGESLLTGTVLPDYVTLCLECHQHEMGGSIAIEYANKKHGLAPAEPVGPAGWPLAEPFVDETRGLYFLDCLDCHEAHGSENAWLIKRSMNSSTAPDIVTETSSIEWAGICDGCHQSDPQARHHNQDVRDKLGVSSGDCLGCHESHGGGGSMYVNCVSSGCHGHGDDFF